MDARPGGTLGTTQVDELVSIQLQHSRAQVVFRCVAPLRGPEAPGALGTLDEARLATTKALRGRHGGLYSTDRRRQRARPLHPARSLHDLRPRHGLRQGAVGHLHARSPRSHNHQLCRFPMPRARPLLRRPLRLGSRRQPPRSHLLHGLQVRLALLQHARHPPRRRP